MKKIFFYIVLLILFCCFLLFGYLIWNIRSNLNNNIEVLEFMNIFVTSNKFSDLDDDYSKVLINNEEYIGKISILNNNLVLPVESNCNQSYLKMQSVCRYYDDRLIVVGTSFIDSFYNYKMYEIGDEVLFYNNLGGSNSYRIETIKRIGRLDNALNIDGELLILIKNYIGLEYIVFGCNMI